MLGAAFKPGTDDLREAPALHLASALAAEGATVRLWDPVALPRVKEAHPEFEAVADLRAAITDAHAVIVATEWDEVRDLSPQDFLDQMAYPIVVDGRNVFDPARCPLHERQGLLVGEKAVPVDTSGVVGGSNKVDGFRIG
jgi:UDPglucose 6-dehydrogenase